MHLTESFSDHFTMVPVVNEVAAVIAAEYFNEVNQPGGSKAVALVTAGPGLTNAVTGIAGAYTESREVLIVGGQVKSSDLARGGLRQRGIQEIDGVGIVERITLRSLRIEKPCSLQEIRTFIEQDDSERRGPIFLEICLDVQNTQVSEEETVRSLGKIETLEPNVVAAIRSLIRESKRPVFLLGSGVNLTYIPDLLKHLERLSIPVMTSWNAADRVSCEHPLYFGRPNNWGQRHSNIILQQADLIIAAGTRLGLQQTGFNWEEFAPLANLVQIDLDSRELSKGHPIVTHPLCADASSALEAIFFDLYPIPDVAPNWIEFCRDVQRLVPVPDPENTAAASYVELFGFLHRLSEHIDSADVIIPSSSGGGSTATMQVLAQKGLPQRIVTNKGMASMGYGLPGAIGSSFAREHQTTWLIDGDGGILQNIQELGVISQFQLNVRIFVISNHGYASIRSTQRNYFDGRYVACDPPTGLFLPDWQSVAQAFRVPFYRISVTDPFSKYFTSSLNDRGPWLYEIPVDPDQTFYPKITSAISDVRGMVSNPIHRMTPDLPADLERVVFPFIPKGDPS